MLFMETALLGAQIVAFTLSVSLILLVGAVQANTEISNVWKTHANSNNLKSSNSRFSAFTQRFQHFLRPNATGTLECENELDFYSQNLRNAKAT